MADKLKKGESLSDLLLALLISTSHVYAYIYICLCMHFLFLFSLWTVQTHPLEKLVPLLNTRELCVCTLRRHTHIHILSLYSSTRTCDLDFNTYTYKDKGKDALPHFPFNSRRCCCRFLSFTLSLFHCCSRVSAVKILFTLCPCLFVCLFVFRGSNFPFFPFFFLLKKVFNQRKACLSVCLSVSL